MDKFTIREATREDAKLIYDFIIGLARYEKMEELVVTNPQMLEKSIFDEGYAKVIIGEEAGVPVGFALYFFNFSTFEGRPGLYLEDLFIREEYRNKGYGKAMLKKLAGIAVKNNCKRFEWWCLDWNKPSIDFYKSLGAVGMEEWTTYRMDGEVLKEFGTGK
ncbi:MAG: GNAT family N-acetyltransferase [Tissierellia bacterium]|nr:GNAT family N-acetyltransferase [Tissierellia bacterium]